MTWGVTGLGVSFGRSPALRGIDLVVGPGDIVAVVGGDGAGKTTLLRVLAGVPLTITGEVRIPAADRIGYVSASGGVYPDLTVSENLEFVAGAYGAVDRGLADDLLERTGLAAFAERLAGNLSGGMRRKLAVIGAMVHRPDLLVLDEPTTGVDPVSRADLWRLVAAAAAGGSAVVVSSAYLDEAERASSIIVLDEGTEVVAGSLEAVFASMTGAVVETSEPTDPALAWRSGPIWREWHPDAAEPDTEPHLEDVVIVAALRRESGR